MEVIDMIKKFLLSIALISIFSLPTNTHTFNWHLPSLPSLNSLGTHLYEILTKKEVLVAATVFAGIGLVGWTILSYYKKQPLLLKSSTPLSVIDEDDDNGITEALDQWLEEKGQEALRFYQEEEKPFYDSLKIIKKTVNQLVVSLMHQRVSAEILDNNPFATLKAELIKISQKNSYKNIIGEQNYKLLVERLASVAEINNIENILQSLPAKELAKIISMLFNFDVDGVDEIQSPLKEVAKSKDNSEILTHQKVLENSPLKFLYIKLSNPDTFEKAKQQANELSDAIRALPKTSFSEESSHEYTVLYNLIMLQKQLNNMDLNEKNNSLFSLTYENDDKCKPEMLKRMRKNIAKIPNNDNPSCKKKLKTIRKNIANIPNNIHTSLKEMISLFLQIKKKQSPLLINSYESLSQNFIKACRMLEETSIFITKLRDLFGKQYKMLEQFDNLKFLYSYISALYNEMEIFLDNFLKNQINNENIDSMENLFKIENLFKMIDDYSRYISKHESPEEFDLNKDSYKTFELKNCFYNDIRLLITVILGKHFEVKSGLKGSKESYKRSNDN